MARKASPDGRDAYNPSHAAVAPEILPLVEEAHRIWVWSGSLAGSHFASHKLWLRLNMSTSGSAAVVVAAVTGVSALAEMIGRFGIGLASLAAAFLASVGSVAGASEHASTAREAGNLYAALRDDIRQFVLIDALVLDYAEARKILGDLSRRYHEANSISEPPMSWPYGRFSRQVDPSRTSHQSPRPDANSD